MRIVVVPVLVITFAGCAPVQAEWLSYPTTTPAELASLFTRLSCLPVQ
jgi:hypothetical protein